MYNFRSRYWHCVITQENFNFNVLEYIQSLYAKGLSDVRFSVLHTHGSKPHYHIVFYFDCGKIIDFLEEIQKNINSSQFVAIKNIIGFVEYITKNGGFHKNIFKGVKK